MFSSMYKFYALVLALLFLSTTNIVAAQAPTCGEDVPYFPVDLTGSPDSVWVSPSHSRSDNCCGTTSPDRCTSFEIILDANAAMINFEIASGAIPPGSMFYQIDCGPETPVGDAICLEGIGPHHLTFCKPGNNENSYRITSIPEPIFPDDDSTRIGCTLPLEIQGLESITINSVFPGAPGDYNSFLSCTDCATPGFAPGLGAPAFIDYEICGTPIASICGYVYECATVRLYAFAELDGSVTPNPASFCSGGTGVPMVVTGIGGDTDYSFEWFNSAAVSVGVGAAYNATSEENFTVEISDGLNSATCPSKYITVPVTVGTPPAVDAGPPQVVCANDPIIYLDGAVSDASGGVWTGGAGSFFPDNTTLFASYTPSAGEITSGSVTLTLTSVGAGGGCSEASGMITITFSDTMDVAFTTPTLLCNNSIGALTANVSSGIAPYTFLWNTGESTNSILATEGAYWIDVTDDVGCIHTEAIFISAPAALGLTLSSTDVTIDGGSDGTATAVVFGGTPSYSYLWSNGDVTPTATGLSYGIATVTITDANGCTITESVVVNEPQCSSFSVSAIFTNVSCFGGDDGTATATASSGFAPYTYSWNTDPVTLGSIATGLSSASFTVTATDFNGCVRLETVSISEPSQITNAMTWTNVPVIGENTGTATANPSGGTPGYAFIWSPGGEITAPIISLFAGTYYVDITDANLCTISDSVLITEPPCNNFNIGIVGINVLCAGDSNGSATVYTAHGTAPYTILWSDGQTTATATDLAAGFYSVTVTDSSNCTVFDNITITEPTPLSIGLTPGAVSCFGAGDGTIDLVVTGGVYPYIFSWSTGGQIIGESEDLVNLEPGTYSIIVTDANGCVTESSVGITQPAQLVATSTKINASCNGFSDGSIDADVVGGTLPYIYAWTGPALFTAATEDITGLESGLYSFLVADANGCTLTAPHEVYINQPDSVIIHTITTECPVPGDLFTTVTVDSITGGSETLYNFSFDNGVTYEGLGVLSVDLLIGATYSVVAVDDNGCSTFAPPFSLTIDPAVVIDAVTFDPCIAELVTDIPVTITVSGGDGGPYEVSSDNGLTFNAPGTMTINLPIGTVYHIVVRDTKGCLSTEFEITLPVELIVSGEIQSEVGCLGGSDGSISLTVTGGVSPYTYSWTGPDLFTSTSEDIFGLIEGTYLVTVTDDSSCTGSTSVLLTTIVDETLPTITCPGDVSLNNDPGVCGAIVTYSTPIGSDNCPLGTNTVLTAGLASGASFPVGITTVTYTVTDSAGNTASCSFDVTVVDNENPTIICPADIAADNDPGVCEAGTVVLGAPTTADNCGVASVTNDAPATFPVGTTTVTWTVTDENGNTANCTQDVVITDIEDPIIICPADVAVDSDPGVCEAGDVALGTPTTDDNCGVATVTNDAPLVYPIGTTVVTWTVTDDNGNIAICTQNIVVTDNELPTMIYCPTDTATCFAVVNYEMPMATDNCGIASIVQTSGLGPGATFTVGTTTEEYEITDVNGNITICSFDITIHSTPVASTTGEDVTCNSYADGAIDLTVADGTAPFDFSWSSGEITEDLIDLGPGTYDVTITDDNGCIATASYTIGQPDTISIIETHINVSCYGFDDGLIDIVAMGGTTPYSYLWTTGETLPNIDTLIAGTYDLTLTDANDCVYDLSVEITEPDSLYASSTTIDATCLSEDGVLDLTVYGGVIPYDYTWSNADTTQDLDSIPSAMYTVIIVDANGCELIYSDSVGFTNPLAINANIIDPLCFGDTTGIIEVRMIGAVAPIIYNWSTGDTTATLTNVTAGDYTLTVTDSNGCEISSTYSLIEPDSLYLDLYSPEDEFGYNITTFMGEDGWIDLTVYGGAPDYLYLWSDGSTSEDIEDLTAGLYSVLVTDLNGCTVTGSIDLIQPLTLEMPTGFTPNGDGYNDFFVINGLDIFPNNEIVIYSRWGNIVYSQSDYANEWYGNNNAGKELPDGTYYVILTIDGLDPMTGYVDLRRKR
ncbi:MAG: HYR domain-containing protein [Crocinitomix sp.]|nr:HYR domain-containing protein [Crocinitomix sp.]